MIFTSFIRIFETSHLALLAHTLYYYTVVHHANYAIHEKPVWYSVCVLLNYFLLSDPQLSTGASGFVYNVWIAQ
jgi:hypothetical protein